MTPQDLKKHYISCYNFQKITGISRQSFNNWQKWGYVPASTQYKLENITDGKLKIGAPFGSIESGNKQSSLGRTVVSTYKCSTVFEDYNIDKIDDLNVLAGFWYVMQCLKDNVTDVNEIIDGLHQKYNVSRKFAYRIMYRLVRELKVIKIK